MQFDEKTISEFIYLYEDIFGETLNRTRSNSDLSEAGAFVYRIPHTFSERLEVLRSFLFNTHLPSSHLLTTK